MGEARMGAGRVNTKALSKCNCHTSLFLHAPIKAFEIVGKLMTIDINIETPPSSETVAKPNRGNSRSKYYRRLS